MAIVHQRVHNQPSSHLVEMWHFTDFTYIRSQNYTITSSFLIGLSFPSDNSSALCKIHIFIISHKTNLLNMLSCLFFLISNLARVNAACKIFSFLSSFDFCVFGNHILICKGWLNIDFLIFLQNISCVCFKTSRMLTNIICPSCNNSVYKLKINNKDRTNQTWKWKWGRNGEGEKMEHIKRKRWMKTRKMYFTLCCVSQRLFRFNSTDKWCLRKFVQHFIFYTTHHPRLLLHAKSSFRCT